MNRIPPFDLARAIEPLAEQIETSWQSLLRASSFVGGEEVDRFEQAYAEYTESSGCVGVGNGTDALILALKALDVQPGDEVIVPSYTFIATAAAVVLVGGTPVFADVEAETLNLDVGDAADRVTDRTVGVIGVHLYGRPFAVDQVRALCEESGLWLIEDAAQAHGATWHGARVGNFGSLATWSFYPAKNLGCFGDGGAVTGNRPDLLDRVRRLANHGRLEHYRHGEPGMNSRLDALQAAVLNCRLPGLEEQNRRRAQIASRYREALSAVRDLRFLTDDPDSSCVYHQMTILTDRRDELRQHLDDKGIGTGIHYPLALHLQPAFAGATESVGLEVAAAAGNQVLCLPMFPELTDEEVDRVCEAIRRFF